MSNETKPGYSSYEGSFDLYPERRSKTNHSLFSLSNKNYERIKCESNVIRCFKNNPLVKILIGALKKNGCPVNLRRHVVCEPCDTKVTGGYDCEYNQIVVCQNSKKVSLSVEPVLIHELIHMYDYCIGKLDFKNLEHLACTEIRAANLCHCSFLSSWLLGQSSPFNIKKTHQYCVKLKAAQSLVISRNLDLSTALEYVLKVFDKCYNDLEPIGRRIRRNSSDSNMSLKEAEHFDIIHKTQ